MNSPEFDFLGIDELRFLLNRLILPLRWVIVEN
jgi:hypothetical protein